MNASAPRKFFALLILISVQALHVPTQARADTANLSFTSAATAIDFGQQDGVFDAFAPFNFGSVNNNGYTSYRTALEFDLSPLPTGATINSATLSMFVNFVEGTRQIAINGYTGDGAVNLADFSGGSLVGTTTLNPPGSQFVTFAVTSFLGGLASGGQSFAGFDVSENPANSSNFTVLFFAMSDGLAPQLSIDFTTTSPIPEPESYALLLAGLGLLGFLGRRRKLKEAVAA